MTVPEITETNYDVCRVCGSKNFRVLGEVEYFINYAYQVSDCIDCGCLYTPHNDAVHEIFHQSGAISYYADYRELAAEIGKLFAGRKKSELRHRLCSEASKYRFVIEQVKQLSLGADCLEVGCSRGYLTSSLILDGRNILGVDVSKDAVNEAQAVFGDHFALVDSERAENGGPYDFIYHVGVIGCVANPIELTRKLLEKLKPGGKLVFNAPNRNACVLRDQLWLDSAPPPDLVTLFPHDFWRNQFGDLAEVQETIEVRSPGENFSLWLDQVVRRRWSKPQSQPLTQSDERRVWLQPSELAWHWIQRSVGKGARMVGVDKLFPAIPTDFGLFVTLRRKN